MTSIVAIAIPRSATVSVGTPGRTLPMSAITIASQRERVGVTSGYCSSAPPPTSSWPSMITLMPTGGRPFQARSAPTWLITLALESDVPRP